MAGNNVIKITALTALKGNFLKAIFVCLVFLFSIFLGPLIFSLVSIFAGEVVTTILEVLYFILAVYPIFLGALRYCWRVLFSADDNPVSIFYYFSSGKLYIKAIKLLIQIALRFVLPLLLVSLPVLFVRLISLGKIFEMMNMSIPLWSPNLTYVSVFLSTLGFVTIFLYSLKFYLAPILFVADDNIDTAEAIHMSTVISKKTSLEFLYLIFGFLGWIFISVFIIPLVFTLPYFLTSYAVFARFAITEHNMSLKKIGDDSFPTFVAGV